MLNTGENGYVESFNGKMRDELPWRDGGFWYSNKLLQAIAVGYLTIYNHLVINEGIQRLLLPKRKD